MLYNYGVAYGAGAGYSWTQDFYGNTGIISTKGLVAVSDPSKNNSKNIILSLKKGDIIKCTFVGTRWFEGGPQINEVRALTVYAISYNPPIPPGITASGELAHILVDENPGRLGFDVIKAIEYPDPPAPHVPSGLKPNTLYNY